MKNRFINKNLTPKNDIDQVFNFTSPDWTWKYFRGKPQFNAIFPQNFLSIGPKLVFYMSKGGNPKILNLEF